MIIIGEYKPINFTYYNPRTGIFKSGKSDRERIFVYKCNNCENCDAYKRKCCVMLNGLWWHKCPYGAIEKKEGFTKAARKCGYLKNYLDAFTKYMDDNGLKKNEPYKLFMSDLCTSMTAKSIEELYVNFKIFVDGFCNQDIDMDEEQIIYD